MITKYTFFGLVVLFLLPTNLEAQSTTGRKIETVGKDVEEADDALVKGKALVDKIFKKKDSKGNREKSTGEKSSPTASGQDGADGNNGQFPDSKSKETIKEKPHNNDKSANTLKPGDVHPDAVVLDVDELYPFHNGAAIVKKGSSTALINAKGEVIVPFNTYESSFSHIRSENGFFFFDFDHKGVYTIEAGYINESSIPHYYNYDQDYLGLRDVNTYTFRLINRTGKRYNVVYNLTEIKDKSGRGDIVVQMSNGMITVVKNGKWGFKNIYDKAVVSPIYDEVKPFSDGVAIVGKVNEFGEMKYGYIDTQGKAITLLQYSKIPKDFSWGYAKIYHNNDSPTGGRKYSFINKKGELVLTEEKTDFTMIYEGLALDYGKQNLWKTNGERISVDDYCESMGLTRQEIHGYPKKMTGAISINPPALKYPNNEEIIQSKVEISFIGIDKELKTGIMDIEKGSLFYTGRLYFLSGFEKKSKLALVQIYDNGGSSVHTKGYINEEGIFMIVKGEASKW